MITLSEDALALVAAKQSPLCIDIPHAVSACCLEITDCPSVSFGEPRKLDAYDRKTLQNAVVYVPRSFPEDGDFVIRTKSFFGFTRLVLSGWRLM